MSEDDSVEEVESGAEVKGKGAPWLPLILVLLVVPIITIAGMEFVVIPKLIKALASQSAEPNPSKQEHSKERDGGGSQANSKKSPDGSSYSYRFEEVISNLSGTMGTRFIKSSFEVTSDSAELRSMIQGNKAQVQDAVMGVLSSRTIKELEVVGGRNALRVNLIEAINQALGVSIVKELYFIELIIQ